MAAEGLRLTSFCATPVCSPSRAALLTGRYPPRSGIFRVIGPDDAGGIPSSEVTLPEGLKTRGYRTAAVGKWHLGHRLRRFLPTENGFDEYFGLLYSNDMIPPWVETRRPLALYRDAAPVECPVDQTTLTERYTERAVDFIRRSRGAPFFLYLAYSMPHVPISVSENFAGRSRGGLYGDVIEAIDWSAGRIRDALKEEGLSENTLVIFTSDNGPWLDLPPRMFREGRIQSSHVGSPGSLRGSKASTYEGGVRVPMIACWPGRIPPGRVSADLGSVMDLYPTFLSLAGAAPPADRPVDGLDLSPLLFGTGPSPRTELLYFQGKALEAVRMGKWKLRVTHREAAPDESSQRIELFDLESDPSERWNLAAKRPEVCARLRRRLEEAARTVPCGRALESMKEL